MEEENLWELQLKKFTDAYFSPGNHEQFLNYMKKRGTSPDIAKDFIPQEAEDLFTSSNNIQYHLIGRSVFGIQRKWNLRRVGTQYQIVHGCSINPGLIQFDHSGFLSGTIKESFIEAKTPEELLKIAKRLLNSSNEDMSKEFNIKSSQSDIATLFNAIILDTIIDYEIERKNFKGYSHCWNDDNFISLSATDQETAYSIGLSNSSRDRYEPNKLMILQLPNEESITFKQIFNNKENTYEYSIDDICTEIMDIKGNSELLKRVVSQIERFSEKELKQQEEMLSKQIIVKKIQLVYDGLINGSNTVQTISLEEFELLNEMLQENLDKDCLGYISSENTISNTNWHTPIPVSQYSFIQLSNGRRISAEFFARENSGLLKAKNFNQVSEPLDDSDFIVSKPIDEQDLITFLNSYNTSQTLDQLLERQSQLSKKILSQEKSEKSI